MAPRPAGAHARKPAAKWSADDRELMRADKVLRRVMVEQGPIDPRIDRRGSRPDHFDALAKMRLQVIAADQHIRMRIALIVHGACGRGDGGSRRSRQRKAAILTGTQAAGDRYRIA